MTDYDHDPGEGSEPRTQASVPATMPPVPANQVATTGGTAQPGTQVFNPLDAHTEHFATALARRQDNYNALREHLRNILVPNKDFGRIHIANRDKCPKPWDCTPERNPFHYSGFQLLNPGADKVLNILGLRPGYDDVMADYRRASLKGIKIQDVILTCRIYDHNNNVIAEGTGAASMGQHNYDLSNTIKKAQKRARVDATTRLPGVSALFDDDDFFESLIDTSKKSFKPPPTRTDREHGAQPVGPGKRIEKMPFGKHKGTPFTKLDVKYLQWIVENCKDKPDVHYSAVGEIERRKLQDDRPVQQPAPKQQQSIDDGRPDPREQQRDKRLDAHADFIEAAFSDLDDDMPPLDAYD
jgi:hypothetical protein